MTEPENGLAATVRDDVLATMRASAVRGWAIVVVVLLLGFAVIARFVPALQPCREQLAQTGDLGVVTVCEPIFDQTVILALILLLVALVLLPVLSKFGVAGFSVELKAEEAKREAGEARQLAEEVRRLQELLLTRTLTEPTDVEFRKKVARPASAARPNATSVTAAARRRRGQRIESLLGGWSNIEPYLDSDPAHVARWGVALNPRSGAAVQQWREQWALEIEQVRIVRNRIAHSPENVPDDELARAVELANLLIDDLRDRFASAGAQF
jgi:hypothetical protein